MVGVCIFQVVVVVIGVVEIVVLVVWLDWMDQRRNDVVSVIHFVIVVVRMQSKNVHV